MKGEESGAVRYCCTVARDITAQITVIIQHAASLDHGYVCEAAFEEIAQLTEAMESHEMVISEGLEAVGRISRRPIHNNAVHGRSATEWAIVLGRFVAQVAKIQLQVDFAHDADARDKFLALWKQFHLTFVPYAKIDTESSRLSVFAGYAPDGKQIFELWTPPTFHELREIGTEIEWELTRAASTPMTTTPPKHIRRQGTQETKTRKLTDLEAAVKQLREEELPDGKQRSFGQVADELNRRGFTKRGGKPHDYSSAKAAYHHAAAKT